MGQEVQVKINYHPKVLKEDIPRLPSEIARRIRNAIENKLMVDPVKYGLYLHRNLHGYRKLRVGEWRIIYRIVGNEVRIAAIGQRRDMEVYRTANKRV